MSTLYFLLDKWALIGFSGMLLNIISLLNEADLPEFTGFSGLAIVGVAVFQKVRNDLRTQEKHKMQMKIIQRYLDKEIELDPEVVKEFLDNK